MTTRSNRNGAEHLLPDESLCLVSRPQLKNVLHYSNTVPSRWVPVVSNKVPIAWIILISCPIDASKLFRIRCPSFSSCRGLQTPVAGLPAGVSRPLQKGCLQGSRLIGPDFASPGSNRDPVYKCLRRNKMYTGSRLLLKIARRAENGLQFA